jgi:hypothetical protein
MGSFATGSSRQQIRLRALARQSIVSSCARCNHLIWRTFRHSGAPISSGEKMKRAKQSVYHDPQRLSRIVLPIMPQPLKTQ